MKRNYDKILKIDKDTFKILEIYSSSSEASKLNNISMDAISYATRCYNLEKNCNGYKWMLLKDYLDLENWDYDTLKKANNYYKVFNVNL